MENYEQKYKEALEMAKVAALNGHQNLMEGIFPELKQSDGERIRKEILEYFQQFENEELRGVNISDWIAWLEKLKVFTEHGDGLYYFGNSEFTYVGNSYSDFLKTLNPEKKGEKSHAWSEDYTERMGQIINYLTCQAKEEPTRRETLLGWVALLKSIFRKGLPEIQIPCTEAARKGIHRIMDVLDWATDKGRISDSDCEDYMILLSAYLPQPKQEWSEKDEEKLNSTIFLLKEFREAYQENAESCINWLKSLKQRYIWKPSDEQMKALDTAIDEFDGYQEFGSLVSLKKDLEKLKKRTIITRKEERGLSSIDETAKAFARIIRANLTGIDRDVQYKFEQLYKEITGEKMYQGYKD